MPLTGIPLPAEYEYSSKAHSEVLIFILVLLSVAFGCLLLGADGYAAVFRRLKGAILNEKDRGERALTTVKNLLDWLPDEVRPFTLAVFWMDATTALRAAHTDRPGPIRSLPFNGKRFDLISVRALRQRLLAPAPHPGPEPATPPAATRGQTRHDVAAQANPATAVAGSTPPHETTTHAGQPTGGVLCRGLTDRVWPLIGAAAVIATLIGFGIALATMHWPPPDPAKRAGEDRHQRHPSPQRTIMFGPIVAPTCGAALGTPGGRSNNGAYRARDQVAADRSPSTGLIRRLRRPTLEEPRALARGSEPESRPDDRLPGFALSRARHTCRTPAINEATRSRHCPPCDHAHATASGTHSSGSAGARRWS
jgi:hypothetical protein